MKKPVKNFRLMDRIPFIKMVGTGNDFLIVDTTAQRLRSLKAGWPNLAKAMCNRRYGVGADGLLVLESSKIADRRMRVFNPDGSEAEMCGNGARCVAWYVKHHIVHRPPSTVHSRKGTVKIETGAGSLTVDVRRKRVRLWMTDPQELQQDLSLRLNGQQLRVSSINTGVPHVVVPVSRLDRVDVEGLGRQLRFHHAFQPEGTNVNFIETNARKPDRLWIRTYERGVEAETLACGTGVAAAAVIHALHCESTRSNGSRIRRVSVTTRSGETLHVSLRTSAEGDGRRVTDVKLEGTVRWICDGRFTWP